MTDDIEARVRAAIASVARGDVAAVAFDDDLVLKLGLDSLESLRLLAAVEKMLAVRFPDAELGDLRTLRRIVDAARRARQEGSP